MGDWGSHKRQVGRYSVRRLLEHLLGADEQRAVGDRRRAVGEERLGAVDRAVVVGKRERLEAGHGDVKRDCTDHGRAELRVVRRSVRGMAQLHKQDRQRGGEGVPVDLRVVRGDRRVVAVELQVKPQPSFAGIHPIDWLVEPSLRGRQPAQQVHAQAFLLFGGFAGGVDIDIDIDVDLDQALPSAIQRW